MPVIRSDGHLSDGAGNHADHAFSYVSYERVLAAMEHLRDLSGPFGYYHRTAFGRETYNLGLNGHGKSPRRRAQGAPTGLAQSVRLATLDAPSPAPGRATTLLEVPTRAADEGPVPYPLTDATGATLNGIAKALAAEPIDSPEACVPQLTDGWLPLKFADLWRARSRDAAEIDGDEAEETWGQGAAGAVQTFNLGDQVDPLQMLRGDVLQLGRLADQPLIGRPAFAYGVRRTRQNEVRFLLLSAQTETNGIGVPMNDLASAGVLQVGGVSAAAPSMFKAALVDADGDPLANHKYRLQAGSRVIVGTSDERGRVVASIPGDAQRGTLAFWIDEDECITWDLAFRSKSAGGAADSQAAGCTSREEWLVTEGSSAYPSFVYTPGPLDSPRLITHAYRYGRWHVLRPGDGDEHTVFAPWRGHTHVARLRHDLPCYPIALGGSHLLAFSDGDRVEDPDSTAARYYANAENLDGGYYPVGRSRIWHGGVHLVPDDDPTVFAPLDGRVVAARVASPELAADDGEPLFPLGSGNFVLIKHRFEVGGTEHEVFGLYMHLADPVLALEGDHQLLSPGAAKLPWLREIALAPDRPADVDEAADLDWRNLYLKVVRPAGGKLGDDDLEAGDILEVAGPAPTPDQWRTYNGAPGEVKRVSDGTQGLVEPRAVLAAGGLIVPYDAYPTKFREAKEKLLAGEVVDLWAEEIIVRAGEPLGEVGTFHGAPKLHVEFFSANPIPMKVPGGGDEPEWTEKSEPDVDTGDDVNAFRDRTTFLETFFAAIEEKTNEALGFDGEDQAVRISERVVGSDTVAPEDTHVIRESEMQAFYRDPHNSLRKVFRQLIVRHLSEWGANAKWEELGQAKEFFSDGFEERLSEAGKKMARYAWWTDEVGQDAGLPSDQVACYYHPVTFLRWLEHERQQEVAAGGDAAFHTSIVELNHLLEGPEAVEGEEGEPVRKVRLRLADEDGDALEGNRYELKVGDQTFSGESGPGGLIEHEVSEDVDEGELTFWVDDDESYVWPVAIG